MAASTAAGSEPRRWWRRPLSWVAALAVAFVLLAVLWPESSAPEPGVATEPPPPSPGPTQRFAGDEPTPAPVEPVAAAPTKPRPAPVIDEISVEKTEVCIGEENLISVKAHTADGTDPFLHFLVGATPGQQVAVRSWKDDDGDDAPAPLLVKVFGKDNVATTAEVPPFVVKDCEAKRLVTITPRLRANTWSEFDLEAKLVDQSQKPMRVAGYRWSFGDGESATTTAPIVTHSYEDRPQRTQYTQLLVRVEVLGEGGDKALGRTTLQLINPAFEDLATKGVVTLLLHLTPRFPELGADGFVRQHVRLFHQSEDPVFVHTATVFRHKLNAPLPPVPDSVSPESLLGATIVPPGRGLEFEVALDTRKFPDVFSLEYLVEGKDGQGRPARGAFSVMRPPETPNAKNSTPVEDPLLKAKILAARQLLKKPYVTDEDLWRLEREGKFADLQVAATKPEEEPDRPLPKEPAPKGPTTPTGEGDNNGDRLLR